MAEANVPSSNLLTLTSPLDMLDIRDADGTINGMTSALASDTATRRPRPLSRDDAAYTTFVLRAVEDRLRAAAEGEAPLEELLGPPQAVAERVVAAIPTPSQWALQIGPVYRQASLAKRWGCTRQAVGDKVARRKLLALTTSDGVVLIPAFQLDRDLRPLRDLDKVLAKLSSDVVDDWTLASWLTAPQPLLDGRSVVDALGDGVDRSIVFSVVESAYQRWAR